MIIVRFIKEYVLIIFVFSWKSFLEDMGEKVINIFLGISNGNVKLNLL